MIFPGNIGATVSVTLSDLPSLGFIRRYIGWLADFTKAAYSEQENVGYRSQLDAYCLHIQHMRVGSIQDSLRWTL